MISALTLYSFGKANNFQTSDLSLYYDKNFVTAMLLVSMIFTVLVFAANMILLISAAVLYVPLLCYIQGNLKEYCCHKIDKVSRHYICCGRAPLSCSSQLTQFSDFRLDSELPS